MAKRNRSQLLLAALCLTIALGWASVASACPSCRQALGSADGAQGDLARGIYYSVMFMLSMPIAIVGTFGCMAYRAVKREQRRVADQEKTQGQGGGPVSRGPSVRAPHSPHASQKSS